MLQRLERIREAMKFNSQICTTRVQSEQLLALGLKKETADMCINLSHESELVYSFSYSEALFLYHNYGLDRITNTDLLLPAWSLHRLIEMMPKRIKNVKEDWDMCSHDITFMITEDLDVNYEEPFEDEPCYNRYFTKDNLYDNIVDSIAWLIKEGYFNKEYLEG